MQLAIGLLDQPHRVGLFLEVAEDTVVLAEHDHVGAAVLDRLDGGAERGTVGEVGVAGHVRLIECLEQLPALRRAVALDLVALHLQ